jgi:hypothetical protein
MGAYPEELVVLTTPLRDPHAIVDNAPGFSLALRIKLVAGVSRSSLLPVFSPLLLNLTKE